MAKLPDFTDLGQSPTPRRSTGVASYQPTSGLEDFGARVKARSGEEFGQAAAFAMKAAEEHDVLRAEDAYNKLQQRKIDLTFGDNGFARLKGGDAVNTPVLKNYGSEFEKTAGEIGAGLDNNYQRTLFTKRAANAQLQLSEDIVKHVASQSTVYAKEVYEGTVGVETKAATSNWNNPDAVALSLKRIDAAVDAYALRNGLPDVMRDALKLKDASQIHSSVITQAIATKDWEYAKTYFEANKGSIDKTIAAHLEKGLYEAGQKQLTDNYNGVFVTSRNDPVSLEALSQSVAANGNFDEGRKNILLGRIDSRVEVLRMRDEREQRQREHVLDRAITQVNNLTLKGYPPSAEQMSSVLNAARGTDREAEVSQMIATATATSRFMAADPRQQEATISQLEAAARKDPTKFDVTVIDRFKTIHENQKSAVKSDPITFAVRQGMVEPDSPAAQPLDLSQPQALGQNLQARFELARGLSLTRNAPFLPLTSEEVTSLKGALEKTPTTEKSAYFGSLFQATGGDFDGYKGIMGQLAKDDPVTAEAGLHAGRAHDLGTAGIQVDAGQSRYVSDLILKGQAAMRPKRTEDGTPDKGKLWPMPEMKKMEQQFANYERDAYAGKPQQRNAEFQTAQAIYAGLSIQAGDSTGILDGTRWDQSMKLATGGIERWNGKAIVMPWGMDRGNFKDNLYRRIDDVVDSGRLAQGMDASKLRDMPLESIGDGRYLFRAGDGLLVDKNKKPIIIDFNQSAAFRASGEKQPTAYEVPIGAVNE